MFIQVIDFRTSRIDEGRKVVEEYRQKTEGKRTARRAILAQNRDDESNYLNIVFFDSYESAMENSQLPETQELSQKLMALGDGEPTFYNLEVIDDRD